MSGMAPVPLPLSHLSGLLFCISSSHLPGESQSLDLMRHFLHKHQRMPTACFWTKSPCAQKSKRRQKLLTNLSLRTCTRQSFSKGCSLHREDKKCLKSSFGFFSDALWLSSTFSWEKCFFLLLPLLEEQMGVDCPDAGVLKRENDYRSHIAKGQTFFCRELLPASSTQQTTWISALYGHWLSSS